MWLSAEYSSSYYLFSICFASLKPGLKLYLYLNVKQQQQQITTFHKKAILSKGKHNSRTLINFTISTWTVATYVISKWTVFFLFEWILLETIRRKSHHFGNFISVTPNQMSLTSFFVFFPILFLVWFVRICCLTKSSVCLATRREIQMVFVFHCTPITFQMTLKIGKWEQ